jgi:hypothetical protein
LAELEDWEAGLPKDASPKAVMLGDVEEKPLDTASGPKVRGHLVLGWDESRTRVTDYGWDYLPVLGYGVRDPETGTFVLHEEHDGILRKMSHCRAIELGLIALDGKLMALGQPVITSCESVAKCTDGLCEAACVFANGRRETIIIRVSGRAIPKPDWLLGKTPMEAEHFS